MYVSVPQLARIWHESPCPVYISLPVYIQIRHAQYVPYMTEENITRQVLVSPLNYMYRTLIVVCHYLNDLNDLCANGDVIAMRGFEPPVALRTSRPRIPCALGVLAQNAHI